MKIPNVIIGIVLTAMLAMEAWTLKTVNDLQIQVASLTVRVDLQQPTTINTVATKG